MSTAAHLNTVHFGRRLFQNSATHMTMSISTRLVDGNTEFDDKLRIASNTAADGGRLLSPDESIDRSGNNCVEDDSQLRRRRRRRPRRSGLTTIVHAQQLRSYLDCIHCNVCSIFALAQLMLRNVSKICETLGRLPILMNKYVYFYGTGQPKQMLCFIFGIIIHL